jgi:hypothetical protein
MDALALLHRAQEVGLRIEPMGEKLLVRGRRGLSCIKVQLRRSEVDGLVACKLLEPTEREDRGALAAAIHR